MSGKNGPNTILVHLINNDVKRHKVEPSDIGIIFLTREWVHILNKPSAFKKSYANRVRRFLLMLFFDVLKFHVTLAYMSMQGWIVQWL